MKYTIIRKLEDKQVDEVFKKYSLRELAKKVGVHYTHLSRIRSGEYEASEKLYLKLLKVSAE